MSRGRILIADDAATYRAVLGDGLISKGYEVINAGDGLEAVNMLRKEMKNLDLAVLDLLMPKMLGFDVLREIRNMDGGADLKVVVISGLFKSLDDVKKVRELGALGFIDKALPIDEVVFRIDHLIHPEDCTHAEEAKVPANVLVNYRHGDQAFSAYTFTVGLNGMFLRTNKTLPVGSDVKLSFELIKRGRLFEADAKVTSVVAEGDKSAQLKSPPGMAVNYTGMAAADKSYLADWIEKIASEKGLKVNVDNVCRD